MGGVVICYSMRMVTFILQTIFDCGATLDLEKIQMIFFSVSLELYLNLYFQKYLVYYLLFSLVLGVGVSVGFEAIFHSVIY